MNLLKKLSIGVKAAYQLGPRQISNYLRYQAGLRSGYYRLRTPQTSMSQLLPDEVFTPEWFMRIPEKKSFSSFGKNYLNQIIREADEIARGRIRLFAAEPTSLKF